MAGLEVQPPLLGRQGPVKADPQGSPSPVGESGAESEENLPDDAALLERARRVEMTAAEHALADWDEGRFALKPENRPSGFDAISPHLTRSEKDKLQKATAQRLVDLFKELPEDADFRAAAKAGIAKKGWYENSADAIREIFGETDGARFTALLAAMSPQTSVESNLLNALNVWVNWDAAGRPTEKRAIMAVMVRS